MEGSHGKEQNTEVKVSKEPNFISKTTSCILLQIFFFIEIEEEQLRETSHRGNFRSRMNNHTRDNSSSIRHLRG